MTGRTASSDFASGGFDTSYNGGSDDTFIAKVNADGTLAWSSYLGGSSNEEGYGIAIDGDGNAWVTGRTSSSNFASGGPDTGYHGDTAFVAKINADGTFAWSQYLSDAQWGNGIAIDGSGNAWVTGYTPSADFASGGFDTTYNGGVRDAFVAKMDANWSHGMVELSGRQRVGETGIAIAIDGDGNAWVTGSTGSPDFASGGSDTSYNGDEDAFVAKINADGTLAWSSYLGGKYNEIGLAIAVDGSGNLWVTGATSSSGWASGGFDISYNGNNQRSPYGDAFVAKMDANGALVWLSYLGGSSDDVSRGIGIDGDGNAWVAGHTPSLKWTSGGFDTNYNGGKVGRLCGEDQRHVAN